jgi:hypothetical protein
MDGDRRTKFQIKKNLLLQPIFDLNLYGDLENRLCEF